MAALPIIATAKLGSSRAGERSRIWIEGRRLAAHGFTHGAAWMVAVQPSGAWELIRVFEDPSARHVAGTPERPIIDITGAAVREAFGRSERVTVAFRPNSILITAQ